jgi:hypothetical protein
LIELPARVEAARQPPKTIEEFTGRASTGETRASIARMRSPAGWVEPGQRPECDEYTVVLDGSVHVETDSGTFEVRAGQAVLVRAGECSGRKRPAAVLVAASDQARCESGPDVENQRGNDND